MASRLKAQIERSDSLNVVRTDCLPRKSAAEVLITPSCITAFFVRIPAPPVLLFYFFMFSNIFIIDLRVNGITFLITKQHGKEKTAEGCPRRHTQRQKENAMNLVRYNPNHKIGRTNQNFSDLFDDFFTNFYHPFAAADLTERQIAEWGMKVDIYAKDEKIIIEAEMAGVEKENIRVDVQGKVLTLGGERKFEEEVKEENRYRRERGYGFFERKFTLPFEADSDKVEARLANGVLTLEIAKPEKQVAKKIAIN
ncbi:MAG: hypothetical protein CSA20_03985 [Deltaproteobacteria bacterium]|nr:MAG: hypothetical protein CSA20_03985 [Deltaproteobacteria bacterium]